MKIYDFNIGEDRDNGDYSVSFERPRRVISRMERNEYSRYLLTNEKEWCLRNINHNRCMR